MEQPVRNNSRLKDRYIVLDGAMGTMLQKSGLKIGGLPEELNITRPELIENIHKAYIDSGANIIYTNTFSANEHKLAASQYTVEEIIDAAVVIAKKASSNRAKVALDIGPIGELLEPAGTLSFEEAYQIFFRMIRQGIASGVDLIVFETMTDLLEMKAAILAAKEQCDLPILATMTFEKNMRTFTGCTIPSMVMTLEGLGVDALGINCSLGPNEVYPIVEQLVALTDLPIVVKPNAGLPNLNLDSYDISPQKFAEYMNDCLKLGVSIVGGCCGTTPEYIRLLSQKVKEHTLQPRTILPYSAVCSATKSVFIEDVRIIGERINPTGKKRFKEALQNHDIGYILTQGVSQVEAGADILDVNVGMPAIDEPKMMREVIKQLQSVLDTPLQIDSSDPKAIEAGLRIYNGKPIVNSVNGEQKVLDTILPLVKKYGAAVVGLTLDEKGIPQTAEDRFMIAKRIVNAAVNIGIKKEDIYIDCLTLTVSAQQNQALETLKALKMVREQLGVKTLLGVSNISFGLPNRELINKTFLTLALHNGLNMPIMNPNVKEMMDAVYAYRVLHVQDEHATAYIERFTADIVDKKAAVPQKQTDASITENLMHAIQKGLREEASALTKQILQTTDEMEVVNLYLIPALDKVGIDFEKGIVFLPQLLQAAQAAQAAFDVVKEKISSLSKPSVSKGKIIVATVKGDIHDIGKNIVKVILENYGYTVYDLGRDVPPETVLQAAKEYKVTLIGLSALMTTTLKSMEDTICLIKKELPNTTIFVGGAVLTEDYALKMGADYYAKDAKASVDIAKKILG